MNPTGPAIAWAITKLYRLRLSPMGAAPLDLTVAGLAQGVAVSWGTPLESQRTHYTLRTDVAAPASGSDGQRYLDLDTVSELIPGDKLTVVTQDLSTSRPRRTTLDLMCVDIDGEQSRVYLRDPINQGLSNVLRIRRNSRDPVHVDGVALAAAAIAPLTLDVSQLQDAIVSRPVLSWLPLDTATGARIYGAHQVQALAAANSPSTGSFRLLRRGPTNALAQVTAPGGWSGNPVQDWAPLSGLTDADLLTVLSDPCQWPGGVNASTPQALYIENDLSASATTPPNGWRPLWRSRVDPEFAYQALDSWWDGSSVHWTPHAHNGTAVPASVVGYVATGPAPGRYRIQGAAWAFTPQGVTAWGTPRTPALGTLPTGGAWLALGVFANPVDVAVTGGRRYQDQEGLLGLYQDASAVKAVCFAPGANGDATIRSTITVAMGSETNGAWSTAGGLVLRTTAQTIDSVKYPISRVYLPDPVYAGAFVRDLPGCELIPGTLTPLSITAVNHPPGYPEGYLYPQKLSGWYALAIETYTDASGNPTRRVRFLVMDAALNVLNGDLVPNLFAASQLVRLGEIVQDPCPDGALLARIVRTGDRDRCLGVLGSRVFQIDFRLPRTLERVALGDVAGLGVDTSGDMTAQDYLEALGASLLATVVPTATGGVALVSRGAGTLHLRDLGGLRGSWFEDESTAPVISPVSRTYLSEASITYQDPLSDSGQKIVVAGTQAGGKPLDKDLSKILWGPTPARAIATATVDHFSPVAPVMSRTLREAIPGGVASELPPPFWADWRVGDRVTPPTTPGLLVYTWKLTSLRPDPDQRTCQIEAVRLPIQEVI